MRGYRQFKLVLNRWQMGMLWVICGVTGVMGIMLLLQHSGSLGPKQQDPLLSNFEVFTPKVASQQLKPAVAKKSKAPPLNPLAAHITSGLGGQNFGLAQFQLDGLQDLSQQILSTMKNTTLTEVTVDQAPRPKGRFTLNYPDWARKQGITGHVTLSLLINQLGLVELVKKIDSEPEGIFDEVAINSVKALEFEPALYQGQAVRTWVTQKIRFQLN